MSLHGDAEKLHCGWGEKLVLIGQWESGPDYVCKCKAKDGTVNQKACDGGYIVYNTRTRSIGCTKFRYG